MSDHLTDYPEETVYDPGVCNVCGRPEGAVPFWCDKHHAEERDRQEREGDQYTEAMEIAAQADPFYDQDRD